MIKYCYITLVSFVILFRLCSCTVIIIGAGPAGIAAATKLLKNNVTDILILDAENRIGGRINSIEFGDAYVDLGAEWCHGEIGNIVYDMVKGYNILRHTKVGSDMFYSYGIQIDRDFGEELLNMIDDIYTPDGNKKQREGITLGKYCINKYLTSVNNLNLTDRKHLKIANDFLDYFHHYVISSEGAFTWFAPSAESDYRDCPGDRGLNWNGRGYKIVLDLMMQKFPNSSNALPIDGKIILNKEVEKLVWDTKDNGVIVKCSDGSWYHGEQVIFTGSLGVLKQNYEHLFEPQLPQEKQLAIENLGIGAVMKVMLLFQNKWWPNEFTAHMVWSTEHKKEDLRKFTKLGRTWIHDVFVLLSVANNPNVLSLWFTGESVPIIEQLDKVELAEGVNFILKTFLESTYNLTYPISFVRSQWYTNPHFRGTYSYQTIASRRINGNENLAKPLVNRNGKLTLMFAGEATHPYHYSTVHGAIETGYREADRVLRTLRKLK